MNKPIRYKLGAACLSALFALVAPLTVFASVADTAQTQVTVAFTAGVLEIETTPTTLSFGTHQITAPPLNFPLVGDNEVAVSDATAARDGWNLTADLGVFTDSIGTTSLENASIIATGVTPEGVTNEEVGPAVVPGTVTIVSSAASDPELVMYAPANAGYGTWTATLTSTNTALDIPTGAFVSVGTHTAQMDWVLAVGPTPPANP